MSKQSQHLQKFLSAPTKILYKLFRQNNEILQKMYNDNLLAAGADEIEWAHVNKGLS